MRFIVALLAFCLLTPVFAHDHGFDPNSPITKWFDTKNMPPDYIESCCGKGDAYTVDQYWKNPDGTYTAVIADGSAITYPDGTTRAPIPDGTKIIVPASRVNRAEDDLDNPIGHSVLWLTISGPGYGIDSINVWCFIRHPEGE
jgi:hypothetical protein